MKEKLLKLGLTERESEAYLALYNFSEATATELAKVTKEHRTNIYDSLSGLIKKGLVTYTIRNNVKYFHVTDPENLVDYINERESLARELASKLREKMKKIEEKPRVDVYEGAEGFKSLMSKIVRERKEIFVIGATVSFEEKFPIYFEQYIKERERKKIRAKLLYVKGDKHELSKSPVNEIKYLPTEFVQPATIAIFGEYVAVFMWTEPMMATLTKSEYLAHSFKKYFDVLWKISKK